MYQEKSYITGTAAPLTAKRQATEPSETGKPPAMARICAGGAVSNSKPLRAEPIARRRDIAEGLPEEKVRVWPELVLRETIATLAALILLMLLAMLVAAPLEELADPSFSMNPSKAPWYFLGLQELLVYFPPWIAGVAIPLAVVLALMAIPYLDTPAAPAPQRVRFPNGGRIRLLFSTGMGLWLLLTVIGLFFRGPNWDWQWPDGTPLHFNGHSTGPAWLPLLVIGIYAAVTLRSRFRRQPEVKVSPGPIRRFLAHLLTIMGLVVCMQIVLANLLNLIQIL